MNLNLLLEALKPSQYRSLVKGWDKSRYEEIFRQYTTDKKAYRIYIPIVHDSGDKAKKVEAPADIKAAVEAAGFVIEDYVTGIASSPDGKRKMKIGKILARGAPDLQQKFANDKSRQASKEAEFFCVISRHPYDIAGMSTDRGWTSCMNLQGGMNRHYVPLDVKEGSLVAYLVKNEDKNINAPSARMLIKPFVDLLDDDVVAFGIENKIYGTPVDGFKETVEKWVKEVNEKKKLKGVFQLNKKLYNDGGVDKFRTIGDVSGTDADSEKEIARYPRMIRDIDNPSERLQLIAIKNRPESIQYIKNPTEKVLLTALKIDPTIVAYISGPTIDMITKDMWMDLIDRNSSAFSFVPKNKLDEDIQIKAVSKANYYVDVRRKIGKEPSEAVQEAAVIHYPRIIESIKDPSQKIKDLALEKDGSLIEKIENPTEKEQLLAAKSYKYLLKYLIKKKIKWSSDVVREALKHFPAQIRYIDNAPDELIKWAISHDGHAIEYLLHKGVSDEVILSALKQNGLAIKWIEKPSKQMQVAAVKQTPEAIHFIHNPNPAAVKIAKENGVKNPTGKAKGWDVV